MGKGFWEVRSSAGRKPVIKSPEELWACSCEYFVWVEANPLKEDRVFTAGGVVSHEDVEKVRPMTIGGLCIFLDVCVSTWYAYAQKPAFMDISKRITNIIREQKFAGATAGLMNPLIIARDLGLAESVKNELTGKDGGPIETKTVKEMTDEDLLKIIDDDKS